MRFLALCILVAALGCQAHAPHLTGQPMWFPLGPDVYHEREIERIGTHTLAFKPESRWFGGDSREVSEAEYDAHNRERAGSAGMLHQRQTRVDSKHFLPVYPPYPNRIEELPLKFEGVRVNLAVRPNDDKRLILTLRLTSATRDVAREVEHRWTNALPFLFAFYIDGQAFRVAPHGYQYEGGAQGIWPLVEQGKTRTWEVFVDADSLANFLPDKRPREVAIVAAFSNRQHIFFHPEGAMFLDAPDFISSTDPAYRRVLIRSNVARLRWAGEKWESARSE